MIFINFFFLSEPVLVIFSGDYSEIDSASESNGDLFPESLAGCDLVGLTDPVDDLLRRESIVPALGLQQLVDQTRSSHHYYFTDLGVASTDTVHFPNTAEGNPNRRRSLWSVGRLKKKYF